ncbi:hypothetical protein DPMN_056881 [Dreissena polymorpha]|uniref:Secreted protein n=1 Tax=Dreissena polymorpha TaxID=45954 RepID=A0A9D4CUJ2_DREPO|nr:hypothetical protein DPMN_056881 [Dreissena polymorpha]
MLRLAIAAVAMAFIVRVLAVQGFSQVLEASYFLKLLAVNGDICTGMCVVNQERRHLCADPNPICSCSFIEYVGVVLEFTAGATHEVNVISESEFGDRFANDSD